MTLVDLPHMTFLTADPDGGWHEVIWVKPGASLGEGPKPPGEWTMIELD